MQNNTFGHYFTVTTFGESHGPSIGAVVDGVPAQIPLEVEDIQFWLNKRKPGGAYTSPRQEKDEVKILSGVFEGKTLGTPIALLIENVDQKSKDYSKLQHVFRPGHADFTWQQKFGFRDHRGGGRSSARETATRVAAGAIALKVLNYLGINIYGSLVQIGDIAINYDDFNPKHINHNEFFAADLKVIPKWQNLIEQLKANGDSIGAKIEIRASGVSPGLGEPVFNKLDSELAKAMMSIPAVKAVEIGSGFALVNKKGSECADEITLKESVANKNNLWQSLNLLYDSFNDNKTITFKSNHSGGVQGGISNGNEIIVRFVVKPTSSIQLPKHTITDSLEPTEIATFGRHDPCVGIRAVPVGVAMAAIVILDQLLMHRARFNFKVN